MRPMAMYVKTMREAGVKGREFAGYAALYRMCPPVKGHDFIVISSTDKMGDDEVLAFPSDQEGGILEWSEIDGIIGSLDHRELIVRMGYNTEHKEDT